MRHLILAALLVLAVAGCGSGSRSADNAPSPPRRAGANASSRTNVIQPSGAVVTAEQADAGPQEIKELMNEKQVYECPKCGKDFDRAGVCTMDGTTLVFNKVDYICPADNQAVDAAGRCPRCAMNARVVKTAMAGGAPATGK